MNEVQKAFALIVIPRNIQHIQKHIPEIRHKIPELKRQLDQIRTSEKTEEVEA